VDKVIFDSKSRRKNGKDFFWRTQFFAQKISSILNSEDLLENTFFGQILVKFADFRTKNAI